MDYYFFIFAKIHHELFPSKKGYDLQFRYLQIKFKEWQEWDLINGQNIFTAESMARFINNE
jgi:hypothetical protein